MIRDKNLEMPDDYNKEVAKWALECKLKKNWSKNGLRFGNSKIAATPLDGTRSSRYTFILPNLKYITLSAFKSPPI